MSGSGGVRDGARLRLDERQNWMAMIVLEKGSFELFLRSVGSDTVRYGIKSVTVKWFFSRWFLVNTHRTVHI